MSLSADVIEWLFGRLNLAYGRDFLAQYVGLQPEAVQASWAYELACFEPCQHVLDWALDHLPEKPVTVLVFRSLCRAAPAKVLPRLAAPTPNPERLESELEKLAALRVRSTAPPADKRNWAQRLVERHAAGEKVALYALKSARQALGMRGVQA